MTFGFVAQFLKLGSSLKASFWHLDLSVEVGKHADTGVI